MQFGGLFETGFGLSLSEIVNDIAGGTASGRSVKAVQVGGPLGAYFPPSKFATPFGYAKTGTNWARATQAGRSVINLHRNRYGWDCHINLRFLTADGDYPANSAWTQGDDIRLDRFYLPNEGHGTDNGVLTYLDLHDDPATLAFPMKVLRDRALPWLDAHHGGLPDI